MRTSTFVSDENSCFSHHVNDKKFASLFLKMQASMIPLPPKPADASNQRFVFEFVWPCRGLPTKTNNRSFVFACPDLLPGRPLVNWPPRPGNGCRYCKDDLKTGSFRKMGSRTCGGWTSWALFGLSFRQEATWAVRAKRWPVNPKQINPDPDRHLKHTCDL